MDVRGRIAFAGELLDSVRLNLPPCAGIEACERDFEALGRQLRTYSAAYRLFGLTGYLESADALAGALLDNIGTWETAGRSAVAAVVRGVSEYCHVCDKPEAKAAAMRLLQSPAARVTDKMSHTPDGDNDAGDILVRQVCQAVSCGRDDMYDEAYATWKRLKRDPMSLRHSASACMEAAERLRGRCPGIIKFANNFHTMIWGGDAIAAFKGVTSDVDNIGESWEVSAVPGKESVVADGPLGGLGLVRLTEVYGTELLGLATARRSEGKFPLLVKFIDAHHDLSVQVHPDDALARARHNSLGKTEMWYVIDTRPGARILLGLRERLTPDDYTRRVADGTIVDAIASYQSRPGDTFFIPAGRIHSIGAGNLLAEIQESSDITYRIHDYNRRDREGNLRQLHTEAARDAIDYTVLPGGYRNIPTEVAADEQCVVRCNHFTVNHINTDGTHTIGADPDTFTIVMCLGGEVVVESSGEAYTLVQGHTLLIPASAGDIRLSGHAEVLTARC